MESYSLNAALADVKQAGSQLLEAYVNQGTKEVLGASRRALLAKFTVVALSAFAIGLSLYGLIFEAVTVAFTRYWVGATPEMTRMASHATIAVGFSLIALALTQKSKDD